LCEICYERHAETSNHLVSHPMQCILTRKEFGTFWKSLLLHLVRKNFCWCIYFGRCYLYCFTQWWIKCQYL